MSRRSTPWPAGVPCWPDLNVPDVPAAAAFYATVLGWTCPEPDPDYGGYVIASVDGAAAAGIGPQTMPEIRPAWTLYIATDDADAPPPRRSLTHPAIRSEPLRRRRPRDGPA